MFYLILAIMSSALVSVVMRISQRFTRNSMTMLATNYVMCTAAAAYLAGSPIPTGEGSALTIALGCISGVLYLLGARGVWLLLPVAVFALPLGLNLVVYPESQGMDASDNARFCCISYILSIAVLPVVFGVLQMIV